MAAPSRQKLDFLGGEEVEVAPQSDLPRTSFFSVEYPALLRQCGQDQSSENDEHPALSNALCSLSPLPSPYATPASALRHMGQLIDKKGRVTLDCRLGQACLTAAESNADAGPSRLASSNEIYRHAIVGDVVDAHNVVMKITKRVWRPRKGGAAGDSSLQGGRVGEEVKEYTAVAMGITRRVARFRSLADFLYDPGYVHEQEEKGEQKETEATSQALRLHDSMRQMDIEALRSFELDQEKEDYEVEREVPGRGVVRVSNIRMPPAAVFHRTDVPFSYGFRQNPTSYLGVQGQAKEDESVRPMRYMNKLKYGNMAPISLSLTSKSGRLKPIPIEPNEDVLKSRRVNDELFGQLRELFQRQPMWSRFSLLNQFEPEQRRNLINQKHYIAASCYTINDGCWRDTLVRFGYNPLRNNESRFYQRLTFQLKSRARRATLQPRQQRQTSAGVEQDRLGSAGGPEKSLGEEAVEEGDSHIFDGVTPSRTRGNYLLLDVQDEFVKPLIQQQGRDALRNTPHRDTGWYTSTQWDKIRLVMQARFHKLVEEGVPATRLECDTIIAGVDAAAAGSAAKATARGKRTSGASNLRRQ